MLIFFTTDRRGIECSGFTQLQFISSRNDETFSEPGLNLCCVVIGFSMHNWEVQLKEISKSIIGRLSILTICYLRPIHPM